MSSKQKHNLVMKTCLHVWILQNLCHMRIQVPLKRLLVNTSEIIFVSVLGLKLFRRYVVMSLCQTVFTRLNAAAFIKFLAFPLRRLFKGGVYSRAAFISKSYFLNH